MTPTTGVEARRFTGLALGLLLAAPVALAAPTIAAAGVSTVTFGGNGANGPCSVGYNFVGSGASFANISGSCSVSVNSAGTVATGDQSYVQGDTPGDQLFTDNQFQGTVDPAGKALGSATSSFDRSTVVITDPTTGYNSTSIGFAAANLADGTVHASSVANSLGDDQADALETDMLHFTVLGGTGVTDVTAQFTLDGNFTVGNPVGNQAQMAWAGGLGTSAAEFTYSGLFGVYQLTNLSQSGTVSIIKNTPDEIIFDAIIEIDGGSANVPITQSLDLSTGSGWALDYANTGTIKLILPEGVTYTSDSGVFLTSPAGVPEPATWATMLVGFGGLGVAMRRSRRQRIAAAAAA